MLRNIENGFSSNIFVHLLITCTYKMYVNIRKEYFEAVTSITGHRRVTSFSSGRTACMPIDHMRPEDR